MASAHLQHAGQVAGDALHQHAIGPHLGSLPAGDVAVALTDQESHLLQGAARVHVVAQGLVHGRLPVVEAGQQRGCERSAPAICGVSGTDGLLYLLLSSTSAASHFSKRPVMSVGARRTSLTFRKNSCATSQPREDRGQRSRTDLRASTYVHEPLVLDGGLHCVGGIIQRVLPGMHQESQTELSSWEEKERMSTEMIKGYREHPWDTGFTCVLCQSVLDGDEVLQRLGHFAAGDRQVARVQEVPDPVVVLEERLRGSEPELSPKPPLLNQLVCLQLVRAVPRTGPAHCRDGGIADQSPRRGCPWTLPRWCRPWRSIRCASPAVPEAAVAGR